MKAFNVIVKVLAALAAVAGAVYVVATYGDQIVAWAKKIFASLPKCPCCKEEPKAVEETAAEEAPAEAPAEEAPAEEPAAEVAANEPVAEEADFAEQFHFIRKNPGKLLLSGIFSFTISAPPERSFPRRVSCGTCCPPQRASPFPANPHPDSTQRSACHSSSRTHIGSGRLPRRRCRG